MRNILNSLHFRHIAIYFLSLLFSAPFLIAISSDYHLLFIVIIMTFVVSFHPKIKTLYFTTYFLLLLIISIGTGLLTWLIESLRQFLWGKTEWSFLLSFTASFVLGCIAYFITYLKSKSILITKVLLTASILLLVLLCVVIYSKTQHFEVYYPIIDSPYLLGIIAGFSMGSLVCLAAMNLLLPSLMTFTVLIDYMKLLIVPATAFFLGYFLITFVFAGFYAYLNFIYHHLFIQPAHSISFNAYLYYSFMIITTVGDSHLEPNSLLIQWLTILEIISGIIWMTVVLASTLGIVQEKFSVLSDKHKHTDQDDYPD